MTQRAGIAIANGVKWLVLGSAAALVLAACDEGHLDPLPDGHVGEVDSGEPPVDAGADGGHWEPPTDCSATGVDVYTPPPGIPDFTSADRGRVIACGQGEPLDAATVDARAREREYAGPALGRGATTTRVLYQVERRSGEAGFSSGVLYLPEGIDPGAPLLVYASGTTGLGDRCAPSGGTRFPDLERALYVLVGSGVPVFVPDLVGLGTPGTMAWLEPVDAGRSLLDGARAALAVAPVGALSGEVAIAGHSAGGHAALAAQSMQRDYAPELDVLGVAALSAAWMDMSLFALLMTMPSYATTDPDSGWNVVYGAMYFVGHGAAYDGEEHAWDPIAAGVRDQVREVFETRCLAADADGGDMRTGIAAIAPDVATLFDASFRSSIGMCYWAVCDDVGTRWQSRWTSDRPPLDPMGAPTWFHHGTADARILLGNMICPIRNAMAADPRVEACVYQDVAHGPLPTYAAPWLVEWVAALASGVAAPACPDATPLPTGSCG